MTRAPERADEPSYGRYDTLFRIAAGGMAEVYAARVRGAAGFQKLVALKRMLPHLCDDERFVAMFLDEGRVAANISSPHVVSTLDLGRASDDSLYLVMELVVGATLHSVVKHAIKTPQRVPVAIAIEMIAQAARGLHDAHEARTPLGAPLGIVHRDVSPQNILVGVDGHVRITDFGVARAMMRRTKTSTGELKGKFGYFSPEQCVDRGVDRRSDVFSLGIVGWEILVGRRLFHADNPLAILERVTKGPILNIQTLRPEVSPAVAEVIARALDRDPARRWATAGDFEAALRAVSSPVSPNDVSAFVRAHGGESLARMEDGIRTSFTSPRAPGAAEVVTEVEVPSRVVARPARTSDATGHGASDSSSDAGTHSAATVDLEILTLAPPTDVGPTAPWRDGRAWIALAVLVMLAAAGGTAAWLVRGRAGSGMTVTPLSERPNAAIPPPLPVPAPLPVPSRELAGAPSEPAVAPVSDETVAPIIADAVEPAIAQEEPELEEPAPEEGAVRRTAPLRARARARRAAAETPSARSTSSTITKTGGRATPPTAPAARTEPGRGGPLLGVDQFERELSGN